MSSDALISNDRQAREIAGTVAELDGALSSEQILRSIMAGLPHEVVEAVRRAFLAERHELADALRAFSAAKSGEYESIRDRAGNDPGAFLIVARIMRGLSQKDLARKLGLREQAIQRWESEKYRSITLSNYQKVAQTLGVRLRLDELRPRGDWEYTYDVTTDDLMKVVRHARGHKWLDGQDQEDEKAISTLVRLVGDHVSRYGTPSLLRTGLKTVDRAQDWSLLSWKAQVTRRAERVIEEARPKYRPINLSWLIDLVRLSVLDDGPRRAQELLLEHGIVLVIEAHIKGVPFDGASFRADDIPVIGMTICRDSIDNFWFTLLHEVAHVILHYRTGLSAGFFDDLAFEELDDLEQEANSFAGSLLIPTEAWVRSPARIAKSPEPIEKFANLLGIHPAIVFGRIRMERKNYSIFSNKIGQGLVRKQFLSDEGFPL